MWRNIASNGLTILIVALVVAAGLVAWGKSRYVAKGPLEQAICLKVDQGSSMRRVSADLKRQGAISDAWLFRVGSDYSDRSQALKAGSYLITEGSSMKDIVTEITGSGRSTCGTEVVYRIGVTAVEVQVRELDPASLKFEVVAEFDPREGADAEVPEAYRNVRAAGDTRYRVALAEGATVWQVVDGLKAADFLAGDVASLPPEGMLAPDSYEVAKGSERTALLARMQEAQQTRLQTAWDGREEGLPVASMEEALTLASLIEKETGVASERPLVASVFVNRLRDDVALQTDPSVIYGVTDGKAALGRGLRASELQKDTPYNTYVHKGLPPGPIANPGVDALQAALHPAKTDYIYFVADGTGGHAFSATLAEHNKNVEKWRQIEAERAKETENSGN